MVESFGSEPLLPNLSRPSLGFLQGSQRAVASPWKPSPSLLTAVDVFVASLDLESMPQNEHFHWPLFGSVQTLQTQSPPRGPEHHDNHNYYTCRCSGCSLCKTNQRSRQFESRVGDGKDMKLIQNTYLSPIELAVETGSPCSP